FTDRLSRLLLFQEETRDALWVGLAAYELPAASCSVLRNLRPTRDGAPLPASFSARPDRIDIATPAGTFQLAFANPETLAIHAPPGETGIAFDIAADEIVQEANGGRALVGGST